MLEFLFAPPVWGFILALLACGVVGIVANSRGDRKLWIVSGTLLGLTAAWWVVSRVVETDVERVARYTRELVEAAKDRNWSKFEALLDPNTTFAIYPDRETLVKGAAATAERIGLKSARILSLDARHADSSILVDVMVLSEQEITMNRPVTTAWQFDWQERREGWLLMRIRAMPGGQVPPALVGRELVR
jgi:hypothetical protein